MSEIVTSRQNPLIAHLRRLCGPRRERRAAGEYLGDGEKLYREALLWKAPVRRVITTPQVSVPIGPGVTHTVVAPELMEYISPMESPQGVLFTVAMPPEGAPRLTGRRYLVLDSLQDPGNVGTIWRTADALGADGLLLVGRCADPYGPKTIRASMGACFRLPLWELSPERLKTLLEEAELPLVGTALTEESLALGRAPLEAAAVVIGNEGRGVTPEVLALCEKTLKIPMRARCESLNAAAAAAIVLWEMAREG